MPGVQSASLHVGLLALSLLVIVPLCAGSETGQFDWNTLRKYLFYSYASYEWNETTLEAWTCHDWCNKTADVPLMTVTNIFSPKTNEKAAYGYLGYTSESIVLSFRGSADIENWVDDFEFIENVYPDAPTARVHHGFYAYWKSVSAKVIPAALQLQQQHPNLFFVATGHSLGGAMALLAAIDIQIAGMKNVQVWNFGQPRAGDRTFSVYANKTLDIIVRTTNHHDIVPHLPPETVGYHHVPTEVWFGEKDDYKDYKICNDSGEDPTCADSVDPLTYSADDHMRYLGYTCCG